MLDHMTFRVTDIQRAKAFYSAALAPLGYSVCLEGNYGMNILGFAYPDPAEPDGKDNGAPGLRPEYHAHHYGAFVIDPEGNNIEAVCHLPE